MSKGNSHTEVFQMKYGEGDFAARVRPAILMRYVEHISLNHADALGVSQAFTKSHHMAFLIAKQAISFRRMPRADETLTFVTEPERSKRVTFRRVTLVYDAQGEEVACVDSLWVLVDTDTRKLLRRPPVAFDAQWCAEIPHAVDMKIPRAEDLTTYGAVTAHYTLCDTNGHINNVSYFDVVCDALPLARLQQSELRRIVLNYHREVLLGEQMTVQLGETENGVYLIGNKSELPAFEAFCEFS